MTIEKIRMRATRKWNLALTDDQAKHLQASKTIAALDENIAALITMLSVW